MIFHYQERNQIHGLETIFQKEAQCRKQAAFTQQGVLSVQEHREATPQNMQFFKVKENSCQILAVKENEKARLIAPLKVTK